jgi:hypothetical protein
VRTLCLTAGVGLGKYVSFSAFLVGNGLSLTKEEGFSWWAAERKGERPLC